VDVGLELRDFILVQDARMLIRDCQRLAGQQELTQHQSHPTQRGRVARAGLKRRLVAGECINVPAIAFKKVSLCECEPCLVRPGLGRFPENNSGGLDIVGIDIAEGEPEPGIHVLRIPIEQGLVPGGCLGLATGSPVSYGNRIQHIVGRFFPVDVRCIGGGVGIAVCPREYHGFVIQQLSIFGMLNSQACEYFQRFRMVAVTGERNRQVVLDFGHSIRFSFRTGGFGAEDGGQCHCQQKNSLHST
jgi:hypothetical protein